MHAYTNYVVEYYVRGTSPSTGKNLLRAQTQFFLWRQKYVLHIVHNFYHMLQKTFLLFLNISIENNSNYIMFMTNPDNVHCIPIVIYEMVIVNTIFVILSIALLYLIVSI